MWTFVIALAHFTSEVLVFKTAKLSPGIISPLIVACQSYIQKARSETFKLTDNPSSTLNTSSFEPCDNVDQLRQLRSLI